MQFFSTPKCVKDTILKYYKLFDVSVLLNNQLSQKANNANPNFIESLLIDFTYFYILFLQADLIYVCFFKMFKISASLVSALGCLSRFT